MFSCMAGFSYVLQDTFLSLSCSLFPYAVVREVDNGFIRSKKDLPLFKLSCLSPGPVP